MVTAILLAIAGAAIGVGLAATTRRVSPWWLFVGATLAAIPIYVVVQIVTARSCDTLDREVVPAWFAITCLVVSLLLYGATAVAGVAEGVRRAKSGAPVTALTRTVVLAFLSAGGVLLVLFEVLSAALHCD